MHESLEEVALIRLRRPPRKLELLVRLEELAAADESDAVTEVRP
jgi:hypothetical protein